MAALTASDWLCAWERSLAVSTARRPCALLAQIVPGGQEAAEQLPIGERDAYLLDLYAVLFGPQLDATAACPSCGAIQEFKLDVDELLHATTTHQSATLEWTDGEFTVGFRLPNSVDLSAIEATVSEPEAERLLLHRCCTPALAGDRAIAAEDLPDAAKASLTAAMAAADPQALTELSLNCPDCGHAWEDALDIGSYLLEALGHWAERIFDQVHLLASSYGWGESDILALSSQRRARYLSRILA
jgi:hypothetical protein